MIHHRKWSHNALFLRISKSFLSGLAVVSLLAGQALAGPASDSAPPEFSNPVITGFAPDPSIVRVGEDFYLVNSSFEYFPGIPVYHSTDLVNWELVGHALHRPSQVDLETADSSGGVHAPTIRYHEGTFYVIVTNIVANRPVNFIVTATDPRGPWSDPFVLNDAPGIDPSLLFDDDGRVWYTGNRAPPDPEFPGQAEIWLQELDLASMQLTGERHYLWRGCCQGAHAEGPHLYKKDGYYYLLLSEGGTAYEHALSVAISKSATGPYRNNPRNPILTHRHLGYDHPITGVGHADLVELADGRWYAVALGWRLVDGVHGILGRETFLVPVTWETERYAWKEERLTFPVVSPLTGRIELHFPMPMQGTEQRPQHAFVDEFNGAELGLEWNFRRSPKQVFHSLSENPGALRLRLQPGSIGANDQYSFAGVRQRHFRFKTQAQLRFAPAEDFEEAGLVVIQNDRSAFLVSLVAYKSGQQLRLDRLLNGERETLARQVVPGPEIHLMATGDFLDYAFHWSVDGEDWQQLAIGVDGTSLSPAVLDGFNYTGVYLGLYASSNGQQSDRHADFEYFRYLPLADGEQRDYWYHRQAGDRQRR